MLIVGKQIERSAHIPLRLLDITTGETLRTLRQPIKAGKKIDIIEQFNEKLMLKQVRRWGRSSAHGRRTARAARAS